MSHLNQIKSSIRSTSFIDRVLMITMGVVAGVAAFFLLATLSKMGEAKEAPGATENVEHASWLETHADRDASEGASDRETRTVPTLPNTSEAVAVATTIGPDGPEAPKPRAFDLAEETVKTELRDGDGDRPNVELVVVESAMGLGVEARRPLNTGTTFKRGDKVWAWTAVKNLGEDTEIEMIWYHEGAERFRVDLEVGHSSRGWRTWSRKTMRRGDDGEWSVHIVAKNDTKVLERMDFRVN